MTAPKSEPRVILIGGSSHVGKSTLGAALGSRAGWTHISTDSLGRHPGRPWPQGPEDKRRPVPPHVAEHYLSLSLDELVADVLRHYRTMWPDIQALITAHATDPDTDRLVLEGSALWPDSVAALELDGVAAFWLTAEATEFEARIARQSDLENRRGQERDMIEKFLGRTLLFDERLMHCVKQHRLVSISVGAGSAKGDVIAQVLNRLE